MIEDEPFGCMYVACTPPPPSNQLPYSPLPHSPAGKKSLIQCASPTPARSKFTASAPSFKPFPSSFPSIVPFPLLHIGHGLINFIDIKAKYRQLNKMTCKGTLRQVFIVWGPLLFCLFGWSSYFVGSESGQKQSVKLLVPNRTQHPPPPPSHTLSVYTYKKDSRRRDAPYSRSLGRGYL